MLLFLSALLLCIPIRIYVPFLGAELAPADFLCLYALVHILVVERVINSWLLLSIGLSVLSLVFIQVVYTPEDLARSLFSIAFFFKPYFVFSVGAYLAKKHVDTRKFNRTFVLLLTLTALAATLDAVLVKHHVAALADFERVPGEWIYGAVFDPTFFGLKFHGSDGINGIAVFFSFAFMVLLALGITMDARRSTRIVAIVGMMCSLILVLGSGSRQAALGVVLSLCCYLFVGKMTRRRQIVALTSLTVAAVGALVMVIYLSDYFSVIFEKFDLMMNNISAGAWDAVFAGRLGLYSILLSDLAKSPIFGSGFSGYGLFGSEMGFFGANDLGTTGYTPHNQYLGALWKMGFLAGFCYFMFLWTAVKPIFANKQSNDFQSRLFISAAIMIAPFFLVFNVFQDGLSSPSTGPILMFILGYYRVQLKQNQRQQREKTTNTPADSTPTRAIASGSSS